MKKVQMKGRTVDDAVRAAVEVLGGEKEKAKIKVLNEGKLGMLGVIGGEEAEVEVSLSEGLAEDARQILQEILDKMGFVTMVDVALKEGVVDLNIKGEDMGRIIGKEGSTLKSLQTILCPILGRISGERVRVSLNADGYQEKRNKALERLAKDVADEVVEIGKEKVLPPMPAADRRILHLALQNDPKVSSYSKGEGDERRLVVAPRT
ncbi:protein jag [Candidatus Saganbacteria bacterium]|nr:protein jag [Candidatus Saganbacteria bacterium]